PQTIGRPIANTEVYILDAHRGLQPIGVPGELYIAGDGLAREYLHRPELTAEKFVANPFTPDTRMYRTGDLARWLDDGTIQYLGRIDTQVKIRGFRIEMGEIEARLGQHPLVQDCAVIAQGQGADRRLVAFYCAKDSTAVPYEELRMHLLRTLPEYMVPAAFVSLEAIPLTPNGKVDRRALGRMDATAASGRAYVASGNDTEHRLVAIWSEVLNLPPEKIGVNDSFFELGGHSLLAMHLMAKIARDYARQLPLATLFSSPTIAALARLLLSEAAPSFDVLVPIQTNGQEPPVFAVPGAGGSVLSLLALSRALGPNQPFYGFQPVGLDGKTPPLGSVTEIAQANIAALKPLRPAGPYRLMGHSYGGVIAYEMARILLEQGDEVTSLVLLDVIAPAVLQESFVYDDDGSEFFEACIALFGLNGVDLGEDVRSFRDAARERDVERFIAMLHERGVGVTAEQFATLQAVYEASLHCYHTYKPSMLPRAIDVSLYVAAQADHGGQLLPPDHGWSPLFPGPIHVHQVEADHFSIVDNVRF
ncbi:MAG: Amino acid adenylation, partial [Acidobacteria bacterium]|nr:Amino acid adenylation [Acidobacteriota bacterium]